MALSVRPERVNTWREYLELVTTELNGRWYFRGVLDNWSLEPSLQRAAIDWGARMENLPVLERRLLREFKRAYPADGAEPAPSEDDTIAWLALMQHYGAPTRLLDWTYSAFTAAFFAFDSLLSSRDPDRMAAVWALSGTPMSNPKIKALLPTDLHVSFEVYSEKRDGAAFRKVFVEADPPVAFVTPVNPYKLHQRLVVQQGLFLCPGDIRQSFEDNLQAVPEAIDSGNLRKLLIPRSALEEALVGLRHMNIGHSTLFPGIDGYSRSLRHRIGFLLTGEFFDLTKS